METANECRVCKDLDPKTEDYTYKSDTPSSSDNDDEHHARGKRQADDEERPEVRHDQQSLDIFSEPPRRGRGPDYKPQNKSFVCLPSGKWVHIEKHHNELKRFRCGSETILLDLEPDNYEYQLIEKEMQDTKQSHPTGSFSKYNIKKIQRVINGCLMRKYKRCQADIKAECGHTYQRMLFHGTAKINEILSSGFDERYASHGMFGYGIYFAKHSSKSNQYAFGMNGKCTTHGNKHCMICERKLLICRVTLGKIHEVTKATTKIAHPPPEFHSLRGVATPGVLNYDEYIVYRGEQVYPDYVITYTLEP